MRLGGRQRQERMRQRFQKVRIVVDDDQPQSDDGIQIIRDDAPFSCRATIYGLGMVRYVLSLRLISDNPNRVIEAFAIETDREPINVLDRGQKVPWDYVDWDTDEDILNDRIGQRFGPTLCKRGVLLGQGAYSPVANRKQRWTSIKVWVMDQFERWYQQAVPIDVHDFSVRDKASKVAMAGRKSVFEPEEDEPAGVAFAETVEWPQSAPVRASAKEGECGRKK